MSPSMGSHALHAEQAMACVRPEPVEGRLAVRVLDTNIVLDLWVFDDPRSQPLLAQLERGDVRWLATAAMREELSRVLTYPHIARRLQARGLQAEAVLGHFDRHAQLQPDAPKAPYTCKDPDDQKFIDLAVRHGAALHSKDAQVLCMKNRLARCGVVLNPPVPSTVQAAPTTPQAAPTTPQAAPTTPQAAPTTPQAAPTEVRAESTTVRAELVEAHQEN